ncbi:hypothetical protein PMIN06_004383 [Paraphaeosphaeria minitans]
MSQFPSVPPPGAYVPPDNQSQQPHGFSQQQQPHYGYQQPQSSSPYGAHAQGYNQPASQKPTNAFGQVFNQAVTQGKPMLDKLGKSISSKLGNKQSKPVYNPQSAPQENHQSYQQHQQYAQSQAQQYQQAQPQGYSNQGQQFKPRPQGAYQTPHQSPFPQSAYGTPASGNSGQGNNYFPPQASPTPQQHAQYQQAPQQASYQQGNSSSHNNSLEEQNHGNDQPPRQPGQGQVSHMHPQGLPPQISYGQASGQQTGVIGGTQVQSQQNFQQHGPPANVFPPEKQPQQHQWGAPASVNQQHASSAPQSPAPALGVEQQQQWTPHQQASPAPQSPTHLQPTPPPQQYKAAPPVPVHPNQQQAQQSPQAQHQQWTPVPPVSPQAQQVQTSPAGKSPAPQASDLHKPATSGIAILPQQPQVEPWQQKPAQPPTPASQEGSSNAGPVGFVAELPADLGSMSPVDGAKTEQVSSNASQAAPYRAYKPVPGQNGSPGPGYTIARRAVSTSSLPLADPWRFADPVTEVPTREFYMIADLVFDIIDRRFEPQNTGLLEASKVLESWKAQQLPDEAAELFAHDSYSAFGKIWSLEGVPHVMVPRQASLMPTWNFKPQMHSGEVKLPDEMTLVSTYPTYMPALNRAGWYKYSFLNWLHQPEDLEKLLAAFCADTYYNPGILNQPDIQKRDKNESPALVSRATAISTTAVSRVCQEVVAQMQGSARDGRQGGGQGDATQGAPQVQSMGDVSDADAAVNMHSLQMQQQFNATRIQDTT